MPPRTRVLTARNGTARFFIIWRKAGYGHTSNVGLPCLFMCYISRSVKQAFNLLGIMSDYFTNRFSPWAIMMSFKQKASKDLLSFMDHNRVTWDSRVEKSLSDELTPSLVCQRRHQSNTMRDDSHYLLLIWPLFSTIINSIIDHSSVNECSYIYFYISIYFYTCLIQLNSIMSQPFILNGGVGIWMYSIHQLADLAKYLIHVNAMFYNLM